MPGTGYLTSTTSTCRECGRLLPARVWLEDGAVFFVKHCPDHGRQRVRIYGDAAQYLDLGRFHRAGSVPLQFATKMVDDGCPNSCGLCPQHEQHVCMPILEITDHCDLACPICLVKTPGSYHLDRAQVARILDGLVASEGQIDVLNLSGGEPTLNPHFRETIEECVSRREILYTSVSTNGLKLAADRSLLAFLAERGVIISLQFDGMEDSCYLAMRGREMAKEKLLLIETAGELGARMSLTFTAARGINEQQLEAAVWMLFNHDHILSLMIQPMAYVGRGAGMQRPADPLTVPDILSLLEGRAGGMVSAGDFSPLPCSHPACFSLAFYLRSGEGEFVPVRRIIDSDKYLDLLQNRALPGTDPASFEQIRDAVTDLWSGPSALAPDSQKAMRAMRRLLDEVNGNKTDGQCGCSAAMAAERSIKSVFIHHFMDRDTFDLSRVRKCCQVYPQPDGKLIPACVHNCLRR